MRRAAWFTALGTGIWGAVTLFLCLFVDGVCSSKGVRPSAEIVAWSVVICILVGFPPTLTLAFLDAKRVAPWIAVGIKWGAVAAGLPAFLGFILMKDVPVSAFLWMMAGLGSIAALAHFEAARSIPLILFGLCWGMAWAVLLIVLGLVLFYGLGFPLLFGWLCYAGGVVIVLVVGPVAGAVTSALWWFCCPTIWA